MHFPREICHCVLSSWWRYFFSKYLSSLSWLIYTPPGLVLCIALFQGLDMLVFTRLSWTLKKCVSRSFVSHAMPESCYWNVSLAEIRESPIGFIVTTIDSHLSYTMLISLFFHPVLIRQDDRSMQSCLGDHFTLTAFCYLLILAPSLHSLAFHLSFIFFNHAHATIFFLFVFSFASMI